MGDQALLHMTCFFLIIEKVEKSAYTLKLQGSIRVNLEFYIPLLELVGDNIYSWQFQP